MKKTLYLTGFLAAITLGTSSLGTVARASDNVCDVPMSQWQSRNAVRVMIEALGWDIRRIKIDDGCYEVYAYDTKGREIEVKIDPSILKIVEFEYEDDDDDDDD